MFLQIIGFLFLNFILAYLKIRYQAKLCIKLKYYLFKYLLFRN